MKPYKLALVLVKVFGLTLCVTSVTWLLTGLVGVLCFAAGYNAQHLAMHEALTATVFFQYLIQTFPTGHIFAFLAGGWCILSTPDIVKGILKITPEEH